MGTGSRMLDDDARGHSGADGRVCSRHLTDIYLQERVRAEGGSEGCDFCSGPLTGDERSVPVDDLLDWIVAGIRRVYEDPVESAPIEAGEYQIDVADHGDVIADLGITDCDELIEVIIDALPEHDWVDKDWMEDPNPLFYGWESFQRYVKHRRRYTFLDPMPMSDLHTMPTRLAELVRDEGLLKTFGEGTPWWRARPHAEGEWFASAKELGSPPDGVAKDNRMAPKGISVFSGSDQKDGAIAEVSHYTGGGVWMTIAQFRQERDMLLVDLRHLPDVPSLFDPESDLDEIETRRFLRDFVADLTQPTRPDDYQNLDYIPSQIIAEHLRYTLGAHGIVWHSTVQPGATVCALFSGNECMLEPDAETPASCLFAPDPELRMVKGTDALLQPRTQWDSASPWYQQQRREKASK